MSIRAFSKEDDGSIKEVIWKAGIIFVFCFLVFIFTIASPLHPFVGDFPYTDSAVFETIAMMMQQGHMPYRDSFDHKGPIIYLLNYIGNLIRPIYGVWVIECVFLFLNFIFIYKAARLLTNRFQAFLTVLITGSLLSTCFSGGNMTEEYAMPMIVISLYIFADYYLNEKISAFRLICCGATFATVLFLRANMVCIWAVNCIFIFICCLSRKKISSLLRFIALFVIGTLIVIVPIVVWLAYHHSLVDFWADYIQFNMLYTGVRGTGSEKIALFVRFLLHPLLAISVVLLVWYLKIDSPRRAFWGVYLFSFLFSIICAALGGSFHWHYCMILVPLLSFPYAQLLENLRHKFHTSLLAKGLTILLCIVFIIPVWALSFGRTIKRYIEKGNQVPQEWLSTVDEIIQQNTTHSDSISVYGNSDLFYIYSNRPHATKYSYQFPIGNINSDILEEYFEQLQDEQPKVIIVESARLDTRMEEFLFQNQYHLEWAQSEEPTTEGYLVYTQN